MSILDDVSAAVGTIDAQVVPPLPLLPVQGSAEKDDADYSSMFGSPPRKVDNAPVLSKTSSNASDYGSFFK